MGPGTMRRWLFVLCVGAVVGCADKDPAVPVAPGDGGVVLDGGATPSGVERPGALERPPLERLPEDLKPPGR
jgi:hypothetical protein